MVKKDIKEPVAAPAKQAPPRHSTAVPQHHAPSTEAEGRLFGEREDGKKNTGIRLEPAIMERLRDAAYLERCTKSEVIRKAILEYLEKHHSGAAVQ